MLYSEMDPKPLFSEYRSKKYPVTDHFILEHQKFQAEYAAGIVCFALVVGYFQLLDHVISAYGLVFFLILVYAAVNFISLLFMDAVTVEIRVSPFGLSFHSLWQVLREQKPHRMLRILNLKRSPDILHVTTDDRILILRRKDWPKFDDLAKDLEEAHENGFKERYRVFRHD